MGWKARGAPSTPLFFAGEPEGRAQYATTVGAVVLVKKSGKVAT